MPSEHRLHPTSILFALAGSLKAFLLPVVLLMFTTGRSTPDSSGPWTWNPGAWAMLLLIPTTIAAVARYLSFRLRYEGTEIVIRTGVIFRKERHVPYARIQNLDAVRNVVHRFFSVTEVRVETGGGETPEATIEVLHETVFEEMRRRIAEGRMRAGQEDAGQVDASDTAAVAVPVAVESQPLLHLPLRELVLNGLLENRGSVLIAAGLGVLWEAGLLPSLWDQLSNDWFAPGLVRDTLRTVAAGRFPPLSRIGIIIVGIVTILALVRVLSMIWSTVRLYEFKLSRVGDDLRTEYGLVTRVAASIPLRRVQTLTVRESPLQRLAKRMSVRVETAGGQLKQPREWLAPIIRRKAVPALVREVLPGVELGTLEWQPLHPRAFRRAVKPPLVIAVATTLPFIYWFGWASLAALPVLAAWLTAMEWKYIQHTQWAATENTLAFRSGWLWREVVVVPVVKIQIVGRIESPFDRRAAMACVCVDTAGGPASLHRIAIPYLARETAAALYERLAVQTAQTTLRW